MKPIPMTRGTRRAVAAAAVACFGVLGSPAHAIDVDAGDYTALPAGTNLGLVYFQQASRDSLYAGGSKVGINPKLDSTVGILRGVHFMDIGGYTVDPQFLLPFGGLTAKRDVSVLGSTSGVGDLVLAATVWLTKPGDKTHFGITPFLMLPTGTYDRNQALNLGENRWKFALQAGYITPLSDKFTLDLIGDVQFHGENDDFGPGGASMKQKPLYQAQAHVRYHVSPSTDLRLGLSHTVGGATRINGVDQNDKTASTKVNLGVAHFLTPKTQILATVGKDTSVRNGFKEDARLNLRLLQVF